MSSDSGESSSIVVPETPLPDTARPFRFTWDPSAARRAGPESVSGTTTDGRADYFAARVGELPFSASTASLALGSLPGDWSSSKHGFHAISTVLNSPHKKQDPPKAHSVLPAVPPAELPRVKRKDFDPYLRAIGPEWERFERNTSPEAGPSTPRASVGSFSGITPQNKPTASIDTVPSIFFNPDFDLSNPRTFATVTEQDVLGGDPLSLAHSQPLLDNFSQYADTIESHLAHEISLRSSSFFSALSNLHTLQSESAACLSQISQLRKLLHDVDEGVAKRGLQIAEAQRKVHNVKEVQDGVAGIKQVVETTGVVRNLVSGGQWGEALGIVEDIERLWDPTPSSSDSKSRFQPNGRLSPLPATPEDDHGPSSSKLSMSIPLSSLQAFSALPDHLRSMTVEIASSLSSEVVNILREDLWTRINGTGGEDIRDRLDPLLEGLIKTKGLKEAALSWREVVLSEIKELIAKSFSQYETEELDGSPSSQETGDTSEVRPGLGNHLRTMSHEDFLKTMSALYKSILKAVEGLQSQSKVVGGLLQALQRTSSLSSEESSSVQSEMTVIVSAAAEVSHIHTAKLFSQRAETHSKLDLPEFGEIFNESWQFVVQCEVLCKRMIVGLRGVIVGQAKQFLQNFHQTRLSQSAKLVEDEQWGPQEVSGELQRIVTIIVDCAVQDSPALKMGSSSPPADQPPTSGPTKHLRIEERSYFTVPATSQVLYLLLDYVKVVVNLGMLTMDTMSRVIEFLKSFNSRTCQVVLGAGAMRSAGLRNITAKHLALASQSLSIMVALIPYIRECFRRHLSPTQAVILVEFDKLKRDYQEHQNEIHAKLIAIMGDRLTAHIKTLQGVDWNVAKPGGGVNDYMELLVKETVTLHKVLSRYLSPAVVEDVMAQVFASINHRLSEEYTRIELPHAEAKARLLADAKFMQQKLSALKNIGAMTSMLETVVAEKPLPRPATPQPPVQSPALQQAPPPQTNSTTSQRLKGIFSGGRNREKTLPSPTISKTNGKLDSPLPLPPTPQEKAPFPEPGFKEVVDVNPPVENGTEDAPSQPPIPTQSNSVSQKTNGSTAGSPSASVSKLHSGLTSEPAPVADVTAPSAGPAKERSADAFDGDDVTGGGPESEQLASRTVSLAPPQSDESPRAGTDDHVGTPDLQDVSVAADRRGSGAAVPSQDESVPAPPSEEELLHRDTEAGPGQAAAS